MKDKIKMAVGLSGQFIYNRGFRIGYELTCKYLRSKESGRDLS